VLAPAWLAIAFPMWLALPAAGLEGQTPQALVDRAEAEFGAGRVAESVATFDELAALVPSVAPALWQRGIGLYLLGRYDDCARQFASYYAQNAGDLENASWHFLCVVRSQSLERARADLLRAGPDPRILRTEIYEMMRGTISPAELVAFAAQSVPVAQFYAHLYAGLYLDAVGDRRAALAEMAIAASDTFRSEGGFMNVVARVDLALMRRSELIRDDW
jgi:lipoprotein NlpI